MPEDLKPEPAVSDPIPAEEAARLDEPLPAADDPGGAHAKGFSADPAPEKDVPTDGPVPLTEGPSVHPAFRVPERDNHVEPTGRSEPKEYGPNDRLMGG